MLASPAALAVILAQDEKADPARVDGSQLPKPDPEFKGKIGETYKDSTPSFPRPPTAAKGQSRTFC